MRVEPSGTGEPARSGAQAIERAMAILVCFIAEPTLGISEIAQRVGLGASTVHRIVRALCQAGLLAQERRSERYHLGPLAATLGQLAGERLGLDLARSELEALAERTGEAVNLGVRRGDEVLVVVRIESPQPLRFEQAPGSRIPIHTSAMGKALLAFGPTDLEQAVAVLGTLDSYTAATIVDRERLLDDLRAVRARGYALNDEERNVGVRAVAVPVLDRRDVARAAISVQGPTIRITDDRIGQIAAMATRTASTIRDLLPLESL